MKILYVIDSLQIGGSERSILDITSHLRELTPVVCHIYENALLRSEFESRGIKVLGLGVRGKYSFIRAFIGLKKVVQREQPDLIVATLFRAEIISRILSRVVKIPLVGTFVNDTYSQYEFSNMSISMRIKINIFKILNAVTAKLCHSFLSNSISIKESNCIALGVPMNKVKVIYRGRDISIFKYHERGFERIPFKFLSVGRLIRRKGFDELLKAFQILRKQGEVVSLTIAGEGPYRQEIEKMISEMELADSVILLGSVGDISGLMEECDALVFPSHYEGFSGTIVEAMLSGLPIVASDISMNKEALEHGISARLHAVMDHVSLAEEMRWIIRHKDEARKMALTARKIAEKKYDIVAIAKQHENYYKSVVQ